MKNKIILIDGNSLLFRAYYATSYGNIMQTKDGVYTNAIFALANMLNKILEQEKPPYVLVAFDTDKKTFRHKQFDFYKANRSAPPEPLIPQFALARELIEKMGMKYYELAEYEADDIIATVAKQYEQLGFEVNIFSSDKDLLQLVSDNTKVTLLKKGLSDVEVVNLQTLKSEYKLTPKQVIEFKGLRGDPSDNIPGVRGVGEVTALKLINEYDNIDNIYDNLEDFKGKLKENLINDKEMAYISKELATINNEVPFSMKKEDLQYVGPGKELIEFYQKYEMNSLARRVNIDTNEQFDFKVVEKLPQALLKNDLAMYIHYEESNYHLNKVIGMAFSNSKENYYMTFENVLLDEALINFLINKDIRKSTFDLKALKVIFNKYEYQVKGFDFDFKLVNYLLNSQVRDDIEKILATFNVILPNLKDADNIPLFSTLVAHQIAINKEQLINSMKDKQMFGLYEEIELPLVNVLTKMELNGIRVSKEILNDFGKDFSDKLHLIEKEIFEIVGKEFNVASPKQVSEVLFDELGLPQIKKRSTASEVLEKLVDLHPVPKFILEHRKYSKLLSTYIDGFTPYIKDDGKIHAIFNQTLTQTGRLSSSEPNMQNISVRDEESRSLRKAFLPENKDYKIVAIDYSQVELRILASIAKDEKMLKSFLNNEDIHLTTAMSIFDLPANMINDDLRRKAKAVNFGIVYGISDWGLAEQTKVSPKEAKSFIQKYFLTYPGIKTYLNDVVEQCKIDGYVTTIFGRKREVPEINAPNYNMREFGKRVAMNTPIQGSAADIIKIAMIKIHKYLKTNNLKSKMLLQIHDELVFEIHKDEYETLLPKLIKIMETSVKLEVNLKTSYGVGNDWYEAT